MWFNCQNEEEHPPIFPSWPRLRYDVGEAYSVGELMEVLGGIDPSMPATEGSAGPLLVSVYQYEDGHIQAFIDDAESIYDTRITVDGQKVTGERVTEPK